MRDEELGDQAGLIQGGVSATDAERQVREGADSVLMSGEP